jgi:hypothetical protein
MWTALVDCPEFLSFVRSSVADGSLAASAGAAAGLQAELSTVFVKVPCAFHRVVGVQSTCFLQEDSDADFGPYRVSPSEGSDEGPAIVAGFCMVMGYQVHRAAPALPTPPSRRCCGHSAATFRPDLSSGKRRRGPCRPPPR